MSRGPIPLPGLRTGCAHRVLVYGVTGSGTSTLATRLAAITGQPLTLVDELTWEPGWQPVPQEEQLARVAARASAPAWVIDTAYGTMLDLLLPQADLVVGLDYPRLLSLRRLLTRSVLRAIDQQPICNGNVETWRNLVGRDSIVRWHFASFARKRDRMRSWAADPAAPPVLLLTHPRQAERWLRYVTDETRAPLA